MPKTRLGSDVGPGAAETAAATEAGPHALVDDVVEVPVQASSPAPWLGLRVAVIDDAMHPPSITGLGEDEVATLLQLLTEDPEALAEMTELGCADGATIDDRLRLLAEAEGLSVTAGRVGEVSADALRMIEEHRAFRGLLRSLEAEVEEVTVCDPFTDIPDLTACNLVLLDYYLQGLGKGGDLAVQVASTIRAQEGRAEDQQIVLMSSLESVRELRGQFREQTDLAGATFAFVGKRDLDERWKVKAHLGMLERARPYGPAFGQYRTKLEEALAEARTGLLKLVDDLDIGDYAFLQGHALMKDGHPLGDYVFWLLSSQLMTLAFEGDEMRERQRALDRLEFKGDPFAATEPSKVVATLLHSALVSRNVGSLGPHPRAHPEGGYAAFPLVQLGDVFLDTDRTKAVVVMSADCDLAFSPLADREPDAETPVMLVAGTPVKLKAGPENADAQTDGIVHRQEVYRIVWEFAKYRSVELGKLGTWLKEKGFDTTNRDRLRPLFALKLQQEFGAHLLRVGPPVLPPITTSAEATLFVCDPNRSEFAKLGRSEIMLTRFKKTTLLRVTPPVAGALKRACEELLARYEENVAKAKLKDKHDLQKKVDGLVAQLDNDAFWITLLKGVELNSTGSVKSVGPLAFVLNSEWPDASKPRVVMDIREDVAAPEDSPAGANLPVNRDPEVGAVSAA